MKAYWIFVILTALTIIGCAKENTDDSTYRFEFDFDLNNHFSIEGTGELVETNRAYIDTNYEWANNFIHLNDAEIGDTLRLGCWGNWDGYDENPSSSVKIWFPQTDLTDGVYQYSRTEDFNDFTIHIERNMTWGEYTNEWGTIEGTNTILNSDTVASSFTIVNNLVVVEYAEIKIEHINATNSELRYVIETVSGDLIKGSYSGSLERFKLWTPEVDCD